MALRSPALTILALLATFFALHAAAAVVLPVLIAALLALVLGPVATWLRRRGLPRWLAAGLVTGALVAGLGWGAHSLAGPAAEWLERAPQSVREIERKLRPVREPVEQVKKATEQVERLAGAAAEGQVVAVRQSGLAALFAVSVTELAAQTLIVVVLVFFLLSSAERTIARLVRISADPGRRRRLLAVARRVKAEVASYLAMVTLVNAGLGVATALVMWGLGMPNPALWGVLAAVLNYIPYGGAMLTMGVLAVVGVLTFDPLWRGLLPAGAFLALTTLESDLVTPWVVGRRLTLPPLVVFLSLVGWGWLWGVAGALLAVPILVVLKVAADHFAPLRPLAAILGNRAPKV